MSDSLLTVSKSSDSFCFNAVNFINESAKSHNNCRGKYSQQADVSSTVWRKPVHKIMLPLF